MLRKSDIEMILEVLKAPLKPKVVTSSEGDSIHKLLDSGNEHLAGEVASELFERKYAGPYDPYHISSSDMERINCLASNDLFYFLLGYRFALEEAACPNSTRENLAMLSDRVYDALFRLEGVDLAGFIAEFAKIENLATAIATANEVRAVHEDKRVVRRLESLLNTGSDPSDRYWAAVALGRVGDPSVIESLRQAYANDTGLDEEGFTVKQAAKESIEKILERHSGESH